jgi:hypothetical protein
VRKWSGSATFPGRRGSKEDDSPLPVLSNSATKRRRSSGEEDGERCGKGIRGISIVASKSGANPWHFVEIAMLAMKLSLPIVTLHEFQSTS